MKSENHIAEERRARLRVIPGGLLQKEKVARLRAQTAKGAVPLGWRIFAIGLFAGVVASVMVFYIRLILRF